MEYIGLFLLAAFIAYHLTAFVTARLLKRRAIGTITQTQIGGPGAVQVQTGGDVAVPLRYGRPVNTGGGYMTPTQQAHAIADDLTRRLNDHPAHVGTGRRIRTRNGGPFRTHTDCPACGHYAAHPIRPPNPDAPRTLGTGDEITLSTADGIQRTYTDSHPDRWDERPYEIVRTCARPDCLWEWGHPANTTRTEEKNP